VKSLTVWLDPVSPYAWLAFQRLPQVLEGHSVSIRLRPLLLAGLLHHWGQIGPAEVAPKRAWTYRQVDWLAAHHALTLDWPAAHPFNPLALLRLLLAHGCACGLPGDANRYAWDAVFRHAWTSGAAADDVQRLLELAQVLQAGRDVDLLAQAHSAAVKDLLRANTNEAIAAGVFGVPSVLVDGRLFWGFDGLDLLGAHLAGDPALDDVRWHRADAIPASAARRASP